LAGIAGLITYRLPLWEGTLQDKSVKSFIGPESLLLFAVIVATCLLGFVTIFLYKNRTLQKNLAFVGMILSIAIIALEYFIVEDFKTLQNFKTSAWKFGAIMPGLMVVFFFLAYQGIRKDEKMIKSLERLR
jgi:glucan phosphoethanolaminetransferase (alkaline phosphatase superfamily)